MQPEWPTDETRIDAIGQNGNDGLHYELAVLDARERWLERELARVHEQRREYINTRNLNKEREQ